MKWQQLNHKSVPNLEQVCISFVRSRNSITVKCWSISKLKKWISAYNYYYTNNVSLLHWVYTHTHLHNIYIFTYICKYVNIIVELWYSFLNHDKNNKKLLKRDKKKKNKYKFYSLKSFHRLTNSVLLNKFQRNCTRKI